MNPTFRYLFVSFVSQLCLINTGCLKTDNIQSQSKNQAQKIAAFSEMPAAQRLAKKAASVSSNEQNQALQEIKLLAKGHNLKPDEEKLSKFIFGEWQYLIEYSQPDAESAKGILAIVDLVANQIDLETGKRSEILAMLYAITGVAPIASSKEDFYKLWIRTDLHSKCLKLSKK